MSSFDRDFGRRFDPVEETVVFDEGALQLLDRRPVGDPEFAQEYRIRVIDTAGQEWEYLVQHEISIGRADDNHIPLDDRAISRHHLAINTDGKFYWFRDLDSGNGTQLNGEYSTEGWLTGGEVLTIGNSTIMFLAPDHLQQNQAVATEEAVEEASPEEIDAEAAVEAAEVVAQELDGAPVQESPKEQGSNKLILLAFISFLAIGIAGMGGWLVYRTMKSPDQSADKADQNAKLQQAIALFTKGKKLKKQGMYGRAEIALHQASALLPKNNGLREEIKEAITEIKKIRKNQKWYVKAKKLYFKDEEKAIQVLGMLANIQRNSEVFKRAEKLRQRILQPFLREAKTFARVGKIVEANQILKKLQKHTSQHPEVLQLKQYIKTQKDKAATPPPPPPRRRARRRRRRSRRTRRPPSELSSALSMYRSGQYDNAIIFLRRKESSGSRNTRKWAKRLRKNVQVFRQSFRAGQFASGRGRMAQAVTLLNKAARADKILGNGRRSSLGRVFARVLAVRGSRSLSRKRYVSAYRDFKRALSYSPYSPRAKQGIRRLQQKAKRIYDEAMTVKDLDSDGAKRLFMQVVKILPRSHPLARKAKAQLR